MIIEQTDVNNTSIHLSEKEVKSLRILAELNNTHELAMLWDLLEPIVQNRKEIEHTEPI